MTLIILVSFAMKHLGPAGQLSVRESISEEGSSHNFPPARSGCHLKSHMSVQINKDTGEVQVPQLSKTPLQVLHPRPLVWMRLKVHQSVVEFLWGLLGTFSRCEAFGLHPLFVFQKVSPLCEVFHPLSRALCLKLALELLTWFSFIIIVIQTFPQLVSGVPAGPSFCRGRSCHGCLILLIGSPARVNWKQLSRLY